MRVDGKAIADDILAGLGERLRGQTLGVVISGDPAAESFIKIKEQVAERLGVRLVRGGLPELAECDGIIVQLPNPDADALLARIPPRKDVDNRPVAPVAAAVMEILKRSGVDPAGKEVVVVGEGRLVGKPVAYALRAAGGCVHVVSLERGSLAMLKHADIVVSGVGSPGLIEPAMLKQGVVLIDAGTSEQAGKVVGDCDPACADVASVFTPVPGGVGPIAVAMLFKNLSLAVGA